MHKSSKEEEKLQDNNINNENNVKIVEQIETKPKIEEETHKNVINEQQQQANIHPKILQNPVIKE